MNNLPNVKKTKRGHILYTIETHPCNKTSDHSCPVCDWGLAVCSVCGAAEIELDERDCIDLNFKNMTFLEKIQKDLEVTYLGKKIRCSILNDPDYSEVIFEVKSIEVTEDMDRLNILFLGRVRDWPNPEYITNFGQNIGLSSSYWTDPVPKDLKTASFSIYNKLPEIVD